jgi:hypothetical protein
MLGKNLRLSRGVVMLLACIALTGAGNGVAKTMPTTLPDFSFTDAGEVVYSPPSLDKITVRVDDNEVVITPTTDEDLYNKPIDSGGTGNLNLGSDLNGNSRDGLYLIFGARQPTEGTSTVEVVEGTLDAFKSNVDKDPLLYIFSGVAATGAEGVQYQSVGIFAWVAGLDDESWIRQHDAAQGSYTQLLSGGPLSEPTDRNETPIPATPFLILSGLLGLGWLRRRA